MLTEQSIIYKDRRTSFTRDTSRTMAGNQY